MYKKRPPRKSLALRLWMHRFENKFKLCFIKNNLQCQNIVLLLENHQQRCTQIHSVDRKIVKIKIEFTTIYAMGPVELLR